MSSKSSSPPNFPLRHLSVRVPWHDSGWTGQVCQKPKANASCLALDRIRATRRDELEETVAGKPWKDLKPEQWPACVAERSSFMAHWEFVRSVEHPYSKTSELHRHILPTAFRHPAYSAAAIPFRWMLKETAWQIAEELNLDCDQSWEPQLPFNTAWVQDHRNHKALLDGFFGFIRPETSLCFFYCKQTPLADESHRALLGVGRVTHVGKAVEYEYQMQGGLRCLIWDRPVQHSVRFSNFLGGFILPYKEILDLAEKDPEIDPSEYLVYAPEDRRLEFSYASEHVTNDGAIGALLSLADGLHRISRLIKGSLDGQLKWIDQRLSELWKLRGPFPGLGSALSAFGIEKGNLLAYELSQTLGENENPWPLVSKVLNDPSSLPEDLTRHIGGTLRAKWKNLPAVRRQLLELISRFEVTTDQAIGFYVQEEREQLGIACNDKELLSNPYLFYELDRFSLDPISVYTVDRGMFPDQIVREKHPLSEPSRLDGATDPRRVRAFTVDILEKASDAGDTLLPQSQIIKSIRRLPLNPDCPVDQDLMAVIEGNLSPVVSLAQMKDGKRAYKLELLDKMGNIIRNAVRKRIQGKRHALAGDWRQILDEELKKRGIQAAALDEERAREEKVAALQELASSRFSVLIGPAGTGKTTLLSTLCYQKDIKAGGVLLLAPTGKARVRMQQATGFSAQTLAQFLLQYDRYDELTGIYRLSDREPVQAAKTVIVDEASMLTEGQLGALINSLKGVERYILVGDPRQLPPIGAGRPFVDIVTELTPQNIETIFPKVGPGYAELTVQLRQQGEIRHDLQLAEWFSGRRTGPGDDEIFALIGKDEPMQGIRFLPWSDAEDLRTKIIQILVEELNLSSPEDETGFALKLGGKESKGHVYFNRGAARAAEEWQILSPVRGQAHGIADVNRLIQQKFRSGWITFARDRKRKQIPKLMGPEGITYGDKVINVINKRRRKVYPEQQALQYVANGEIGIVVGKFRKTFEKWQGPLPLDVEFSSQPGFSYVYTGRDFGEESNPFLELAYAITVHKAQGSEFGLCLLILPNPCRLISRELLYTALTRQRERIVILHQGNSSELIKYSSTYYSETARRLTNLFQDPAIVPVDDRFFEDGLIHRTARGEAVRSKSEVIIADNLFSKGIEYSYEKRLAGSDGSCRYPDFTIDDAESGDAYYWEHLGLLNDRAYRKRWNQKLKWYEARGILTYEDGGGPTGTLIVTKDTPQGGISSEEIRMLIEKILIP